ncbi:hypothetical protein BN961_00442 [Afipia felis]|uniref:Uncharacterized protein n=1 Tax=Afipia felis TaxID=1035 RepID=A0A090MHM3_AFIFE|nr:hypothetical protein BN961_00442 [Afipia felis]
MRSTAPEMPGNAASQNSSAVVNLNPTDGSFATTTDQTCQIANDSSNDGIEIHRLRRAMARPFVSQNSRSSGRQSVSTTPASAPMCSGLWISSISGNCGSFRSASPARPRSICRTARCIQSSETVTMRNSSMKQLVHSPVRSFSAPKAIGSTKPPRPPIMPTRPPTTPTLLG